MAGSADAQARTVRLTHAELKDRIRGGWAGQTIGVTFGGPTEFRYNGTMINDHIPIRWYDGYLKETYEKNPGLYDDLYVDLTFVDVLEKKGLDAKAQDFADALANAGYMLWHANQIARYNVLNGLEPPASGHWLNNPEADAIDFEIESDFIGLMTPGLPQVAAVFADTVGHIMNYGDGWYGGVFISTMYSLAFTSNDVGHVVREALKAIPAQSTFHQTIADVIRWHEQYPNDWKRTWFEIQKKWADDVGTPRAVFEPFDIDAKLNSAYVVLGLLYGEGDFGKTVSIATRAGQDSDCNPSSAAGILGTMLGYAKIPAYWKQGLGRGGAGGLQVHDDLAERRVRIVVQARARARATPRGPRVGDGDRGADPAGARRATRAELRGPLSGGEAHPSHGSEGRVLVRVRRHRLRHQREHACRRSEGPRAAGRGARGREAASRR